MNDPAQEILNPLGAPAMRALARATAVRNDNAKKTVGLLNNSKPNVARFLAALAPALAARGCDVVNVVKPRSAGACPDLASLAQRCDYVVNAVAD